uniref:Uncharacterized protein n=1 Tax=Manihot esculenta TaxID=3983 RepID=A0A2C9V4I2_MANES
MPMHTGKIPSKLVKFIPTSRKLVVAFVKEHKISSHKIIIRNA